MERRRKKYTDDVSELLRLMRNMDEHKQEGYVLSPLPLPWVHRIREYPAPMGA